MIKKLNAKQSEVRLEKAKKEHKTACDRASMKGDLLEDAKREYAHSIAKFSIGMDITGYDGDSNRRILDIRLKDDEVVYILRFLDKNGGLTSDANTSQTEKRVLINNTEPIKETK